MMRTICIVLLFLLPVITAQVYPFAFYTLSMNTAANTVKVFSGNSSGYITYVTEVATGGIGAPVQSQQSIFVKDNYLFAVNPGSNTVSLFSINSNDPTSITLLGTPASSGGTYPLSVTANAGVAAVVNSGDQNGIRTFNYGSTGLTPIANSDRNFNLNLTLPPVTHTGPAEIMFTPDGTGLVISNKGADPPLYYFTISSGMPAATPATTPNKGMVSFGFTFGGDGDIILTDAAPTGVSSGVIVASVSASPETISYAMSDFYLIEDQRASCWVSYSSKTTQFYVANAASGNVTVLSRSGTTFNELYNYAVPGPVDSFVATINGADYLYQLSSSTASVYVFSLASTGATWIQTATVPTTTTTAGTAVYVASSTTTTAAATSSSSAAAATSSSAAAASTTTATSSKSSDGMVVRGGIMLVLVLLLSLLANM